MAAKTPKDEPKSPKPGDIVERGTLDDGRPYHDIFLAEGKTYRLTRIWITQSDEAYDAAQTEDDKFNPRLNTRMRLAFSIVTPETTIDSLEKLTEFDLSILFRGFDRLNRLPPADDAGNA